MSQNIEEFSKFVKDRAFNYFRYCINNSKSELLDWKKVISFEEGIKKQFNIYLI
jgi:dTDP-D-glucose 4,6-dehydratase